MTTILIADDHAVVRRGLNSLLTQSGYQVIAESSDSDEAYLRWQEMQPDIMILDLDMPGIGGLEVLHRVYSRNSDAIVIIFSMHEDGIYASRAIKSGAKGYVLKTDAPDALLSAIKTSLRGGIYISSDLAQVMAVNQITNQTNPIDILTPREFEIFKRLAHGESLSFIAEQLHIGYKTVANIQTQLKQKLGIETTSQLVQLAIRSNIIFGKLD